MIRKNSGFTLVELLVAMALSAVVLVAVYKSFTVQQKVYSAQESVASAQQGIRAGLDMMIQDIRMAGYSRTIMVPKMANLKVAASNSITFTVDYDADNVIGAGETISYSLSASPGSVLKTIDGNAATAQSLVDNIDALNFVYIDNNGAVLDPAVADMSQTKSVQITLVARAPQPDNTYTNKTQYRNQPPPTAALNTPGTVIYTAPGDHFRRRVLTATVGLRNLGVGGW